MGRLVTVDEYLNMLSERVIDNSRQLKRDVHQRRNGMEDLYGVCFSAEGDAGNPASFYISLSPDYVYLERFAFKFVIKPFTTTIKGGTESTTVTVNDTSLTVDNNNITPNPHTHSTVPHTHNVINGMAFTHTTSTDWRVRIDGVDITPYLVAQHDGEWINGEGIYPTATLGSPKDFYDILEVCDALTDLGEIGKREQILASRFKKVEIVSDAPFGVDAYLYIKVSHLNR